MSRHPRAAHPIRVPNRNSVAFAARRLQWGEAFQRRAGWIALVIFEADALLRDCARRFVLHQHFAFKRGDFVLELEALLSGGRAPLVFEGVLVLPLSADIVALRNSLGRVAH